MDTALHLSREKSSLLANDCDVVVVGSGPYGLSVAAHLRARGLHLAIFGKPLSFWRENMPQGMLLRSYWWATNLSDPEKRLSMGRYFREKGREPVHPLSIEEFIDYGLWFQQRALPDIDQTFVEYVEREEEHFKVTLVDGRVIHSRAVVMAPGVYYYLYRPVEYDHLPADLVSHSANHFTFEQFMGKQLVIIGGGQSALETAALAYEAGAHVHLVARRSLRWIGASEDDPNRRPLLEQLRAPTAGISPGWFNWKLEHFPYRFQRLPDEKKDELLRGPGRYGPIGAAWLKSRVEEKVALYEGQSVQEVKAREKGMQLALADGKELRADHLMLCTGYRVDIRKLPMLHPELLAEIQTRREAPVLNEQFESSVPGLYFVGFSSVLSCGPLYRFVVGTDAVARRVAHALARLRFASRN